MEGSPAEETPPQERSRGGRQRAPEFIRRQKRRELDARRSKCRIRIGGHLERWCRLKEQLGFALHSQLAQFLLDRFSSHGCGWTPEPSLLPADALQRLVALSHGHGQECGFIPDVKLPVPGTSSQLVWECVAGHSFSWGVPKAPGDPQSGHRGEDQRGAVGRSSPPTTGRRRSLRRAALVAQLATGKDENELEGAAGSPVGGGERREEPGGDGGGDRGGTAPQVPTEAGKDEESAPVLAEKAEDEPREEEEEEEDEDVAEDDDLAYTDDLRDENYQPPLDGDPEPQRRQNQPKTRKKPVKEEQPPTEPSPPTSSPAEEKSGRVGSKNASKLPGTANILLKNHFQRRKTRRFKRRPRACDEDVAQIGPKRIRKAAKREILLCDFEGCGKIFSNRQYLNHHKKYQHVHQKTFTCSEPTCGKSFNFKKHLKEHEKLHSDKRDYICEFCARSFRTSSNLIIHRRIHTGEKPLQCEICGFTCRQKASLNWHMKKHDADAFYQFSCDICGKKFEKRDNVTAHKSKSHPEIAAGTPQIEARPAAESPPMNFGAGMEAPGALPVESLEMPGLGDTLGDQEK